MTEKSGTNNQGGVNWSDPQVPVGNGPPLPRWPLAVFAIGWIGWVAFLFLNALS